MPTGTEGITEDNVSVYSIVLDALGTLTFDANTEVRFDVDAFPGLLDGDVEVYSRSGFGSGAFAALGATFDAGENEVVITTDSFSEFVFASNSNPLPVELTSFEGLRTSDGIALTWETASETDNAGFYVQHQAPEAADFTEAGFVEGQGTTDSAQSYRFELDADGLSYGTHTFRLRQVDTDGTEELSGDIEVEMTLEEAYALSAPYPNPAQTRAQLDLTVQETQHVTAALYNVLGQRVAVVHDRELPAQESLTLTVDANSLSSGMYFVRVQGESFQTTERITVVR